MAFDYSRFQVDRSLSPEEQSQVPMLTNMPETAQTAWGRGQEVYFLSDTPETEQHLATMAQKTPERPYKQVLRDVRAIRPSEDQMLLSEARRDFGANEGQKMLGFDPNNPPNPGEIAKAARDQYFNLAPPDQIQSWDEKTRKLHYSEAEKRGKVAYQEAMAKVNEAKNVMSMFEKSWSERQKQVNAERKRVEEQQKPGPGIPAINPDTKKKQWFFPKNKTWGPEIPEGVQITQDAEGNPIYTPTSQAAGKAPAAKPGVEKAGKKVSYVGWDKEGKEVVERVSLEDTESQSDLIGKGFVEKTKFDRMDMVDRKLAQREAMKRIGGKMSKYKDRAEVRRDYKAGKLKKEEALKILREDFGMTK